MADLRGLTTFCLDAIDRDEPVALITQCAVEGSTPRELGVRMAVTAQTVHGTIGGGNLENIAIDQARKLLADPDRHYLLQDHPLGPLLAQCCGGHVRLLIDALGPADREWLADCRDAAEQQRPLFLRTTLEHSSPRKALSNPTDVSSSFQFFDEAGQLLTEARPPLADCTALIESFGQIRPQLWLFGAGHVGRAASVVMERTVFDITCFDSRKDERSMLPAGINIRDLEDVESIISEAPPAGFFAVFTHSHDLDYAIVQALLLRGDFSYLGLIGSQTKKARFLSRLRNDGVSEEAIDQLTCPIGTPGIESKAPEAVAIALAHELLSMLGPDDNPLNQNELLLRETRFEG